MSQRLKILLPLAVILGGVIVAALVMASRPRVERQQTVAPPPLVRVIEARRRDLTLTVASQGTVRPKTESVLVAQVSGQVDGVAPGFAAGGFFRRGEVLVRIDPRDYELAVERAEAQVAQSRVRLDLESAEAEIARLEWEELGDGEPSPLTAREPQLAEARANLRAAEAALQQARLALDRATVEAPFDGRVAEKLADVGQFVAPGTPLASIYATDVAEIELPVTREDLAFLELPLGVDAGRGRGPAVELAGRPAGERLTWTARIVRSGGRFDPKTRMLALYAEVEDPLARRRGSTQPPLPVGLFVEAVIDGIAAPGVVTVPRAALRGDDRVLVVDGDSRLRFREVRVLRFDDERAILARGVDDGERICVSPLEAVVDGMRVRTVLEQDGAAETVAIAGAPAGETR